MVSRERKGPAFAKAPAGKRGAGALYCLHRGTGVGFCGYEEMLPDDGAELLLRLLLLLHL